MPAGLQIAALIVVLLAVLVMVVSDGTRLAVAIATSLPELATDVTAADGPGLAIVDLHYRGRVLPAELGHTPIAAIGLTALAIMGTSPHEESTFSATNLPASPPAGRHAPAEEAIRDCRHHLADRGTDPHTQHRGESHPIRHQPEFHRRHAA